MSADPQAADAKSKAIAALNDAFRRQPGPGWVMTAGVQALGLAFIGAAVRAVGAQDRFDAEDDPYGEHDFGAVRVEGQELFWKIDYYDLALAFGSPDPADPAVTRRVLTIMLAEDY
jgi:hypothetical protein